MRTKLENDDTLSDRTQLDTDDILRLLQFVLSYSFFVYNDITYTNKFMDVQWLLVPLSQTYVWSN